MANRVQLLRWRPGLRVQVLIKDSLRCRFPRLWKQASIGKSLPGSTLKQETEPAVASTPVSPPTQKACHPSLPPVSVSCHQGSLSWSAHPLGHSLSSFPPSTCPPNMIQPEIINCCLAASSIMKISHWRQESLLGLFPLNRKHPEQSILRDDR